MGCGDDNTTNQYNLIIEHINKCILECLLLIDNYKSIQSSFNENCKGILQSVIIQKNSQLNILKQLYKLSTGDNNNLKYKPSNSPFLSIENIIEKEFYYIELINILYNNIPNTIKTPLMYILINENIIINKLLFLNLKK